MNRSPEQGWVVLLVGIMKQCFLWNTSKNFEHLLEQEVEKKYFSYGKYSGDENDDGSNTSSLKKIHD